MPPGWEEDIRWFLANYQRLLKEYEMEWVAIQNGNVVDHDSDLTRLVERLRARGLRPELMLIRFISREPLEAILCG